METALPQLPDKLYFKIGEVASIVGVKPYVLRYWESEFNVVRPSKSRSRHRLYRRQDVEMLLHIKRLLHEERFTIEGARRRLREMRRDAGAEGDVAAAAPRGAQALCAVRDEIRSLLRMLERPPRPRG